MRANQHRESVDAGRHGIKGVSAHDAAAQLLEDLRGLSRNELLEFTFERLDSEFRAEQLLDHSGETADSST